MFASRIGVMAVALLGAVAIVPVSAQQSSQSEPGAMSGTTPNATVPDETLVRTGAALKRVAEINNVYAPKVDAAQTPDERARLTGQASEAARKAISDQGLTLDQYNNVIEVAQADPDLRERLLRIVNSVH